MAAWTLTYDGETKSFEAWGLKDLQRSQVSQAVGGVTLTHSGAAYDGAPLFAIDEVVTISKDGTPWHVGPVVAVPRMGGSRSESLDYQIADPWWYLEQLPFEQFIVRGPGAEVSATTRIALFADVVSGATVKSSAETMIATAVALAVSAGASMQVAFVGSFGVSPPITDMRDPTCAEVIRAVLRWVPDATAGWDFSTTPPTLRIATRAAATVRTIALDDQQSVTLVNITPRDDLRRDRVVIFYEITTTEDDETYTSIVIDTAGTGSPFRTLKATLPLSGPQTQRQKQYLETEAVSENSTAWWKKHVPTLKGVAELDISDGEVTPTDDGGDSFDLAIVDGQVPGWLDDPPASGSMRVSAKASYKVTTEDGGEVEYKDDPVSVTLSCTYLTTGTYTRVSSYTEGEAVPSGVAAALLAALGVLQYDGKLKIKQRECSFIARPGDVLNLTGGMTAWATAKMQVQKVDENVDTGETAITFGPPKHLSPQDIIEMLRTLRGKLPVHNLDERATGIKDAGSDTKGSRAGANDNGGAAGANWHRMVAKSPSSSSTMTLDAEDGVKLEGDDGFIDHQTTNVRSLYQDTAGNSAEVKPTQIELLNAAGNGVTITPNGFRVFADGDETELTLNHLLMVAGAKSMSLTEEQLVLADGTNTNAIEAGTISMDDGTASSTLEPAHLLLDSGSGATNSLSDEQMVISDSGDMGIYEVNGLSYASGSASVSLNTTDVLTANIDSSTLEASPFGVELTDGDKTALLTSTAGLRIEDDTKTTTLDTDKLRIEDGSDFVEVSPAGGLEAEESSYKAKISPSAGVHLEETGGGIVDIAAIPEKTINLRDTQMCEEVAGVPTQKHAHVLRGESETV